MKKKKMIGYILLVVVLLAGLIRAAEDLTEFNSRLR